MPHEANEKGRLDSTAAVANVGQFLGERKDFEVYSCDISPDGSRLVTAAGGEFGPTPVASPLVGIRERLVLIFGACVCACLVGRWIRANMVYGGYQ